MLFISSFLSSQAAIEKHKIAFDNEVNTYLSYSVPVISVAECKELENVVLLDAREEEEFQVSHIPNATHIGYQSPKFEVLDNLSKDTPIIMYCSIGYRSEKLGEKLQEKGFTNVYNLYGSIFAWVNAGNKVVDTKGNQTSRVHTYNKKWSQWVFGDKVEKVY